MEKLLDGIIKKINNELEDIALADEYKLKERKILSKILKENSFFNLSLNSTFKLGDLLMASVIVKDKYEDINEVIEIFDIVSEYIDLMSLKDWKYYIVIFKKANEKFSMEEIVERLDDNNLPPYVRVNTTNLMKIFSLVEPELLYQIPYIKNIMEEQESVKKIQEAVQIKNSNAISKNFKKFLKESYESYDEIVTQLSKINDYYVEIEKINRKNLINNRKRASMLSELKKILLNSKGKEEITNINSIINLLDSNYEEDVLKYVAYKNQKYYENLTQEYQYVSKNYVGNYILLFKSKNINFNSFSKKNQQSLLKIELNELEIIFKFLEEIDYTIDKNVVNILLNTNTNIINKMRMYIKKGIISTNFIKENIGILINSIDFKNPLYNIFITNINVLANSGINIINLQEKSMDVFIGDTTVIVQNLEILNKININIKTRNLNNYLFLLDCNLENKINELNNLGIDINNNMELLNSDFNVTKRIKLCFAIGVNIYDNGKIKLEILNKDLFFIPDFKIDEYICDKKYLK